VTDGDALLAAILAAPDEDTPRLMYADWLEENHVEWACGCDGGAQDTGGTTPWGEPVYQECWHCEGTGRVSNGFRERAEFIRRSVGSGLAFYPESTGEPPPFTGDWPDGLDWTGCRGFVAEARCPLAVWQAHGPAVVRRHPVQAVRLTDRRTWPANSLLRVYIWFSADFDETSDPPSVIPDPYFAAMWDAAPATDRHQDQTNPASRWLSFHTEADAHAALSRGLIAWAKSQSA